MIRIWLALFALGIGVGVASKRLVGRGPFLKNDSKEADCCT